MSSNDSAIPIQSRSFIEEARRTQIINCAIETIAEVGYANASLAAIAQRAGISKGVISYHFAGKEDLVREVVKAVYELGAKHMGPRIEAATTARDRLRAYIESNLEFMALYRKQLLALVSIIMYARTSKGDLLYDLTADEPILCWTEQIFIEGQKSGEFRDFSPRSMAIALRGVIDAAPGKLLGTPNFDLAAYAREIADLFELGTRAQ
jgi:AcrR family transcriptional regulator